MNKLYAAQVALEILMLKASILGLEIGICRITEAALSFFVIVAAARLVALEPTTTTKRKQTQ